MNSIPGQVPPVLLLAHVTNPGDHQYTVCVPPRPLAFFELFVAEKVTHLLGNVEVQGVLPRFGVFAPCVETLDNVPQRRRVECVPAAPDSLTHPGPACPASPGG